MKVLRSCLHPRKLLFSAVLVTCLVPELSPAASREEYLAASLAAWRNNPSLVRSMKATRGVLHGADVSGLGRGEIIIIRPLLLAWRETGEEKWFNLARDIVLSCNKIMLDGFDAPQFNNASQVAFALPELAQAYPVFRKSKRFAPAEIERMAAMLKASAEYWLHTRPLPESGNLDQRYALGVASVANAFPDDERGPSWRAWAAIPFERILYGSPSKGDPLAAQAPENGEQSNLYEGATLLGWICLGEALGRQAEMRSPEVRAWIDRYCQQLMPAGIMPPYGDGCWADAWPQWIGAFEWAGNAFRSPAYRAAADGIFRYAQSQGLSTGDYTEAIAFADEGITPKAETRVSQVTLRRNILGGRVPDKLILRGDGDDSKQPFVLIHASEGTSHSHRQIGSVCAYAIGPRILLHEYGYDAAPAAFHNMFLLRPPGSAFLNFPGDPKGTLLVKMDSSGQRLTGRMPSDQRHVREATVTDEGRVVYGRILMDCTTQDEGSHQFRGNRFMLVRETVLDKITGILCVRDTVESCQKVEFSCGQAWHVQHVLTRDGDGFLCQDQFQAQIGSGPDACKVGTPAGPVWVAMSGPENMTVRDTFWHFSVRSGRMEEPQEHHLSGEWSGTLAAGGRLSFLTVFVPQPAGTVIPPAIVKVATNHAGTSVRAPGFDYNFKMPATK